MFVRKIYWYGRRKVGVIMVITESPRHDSAEISALMVHPYGWSPCIYCRVDYLGCLRLDIRKCLMVTLLGWTWGICSVTIYRNKVVLISEICVNEEIDWPALSTSFVTISPMSSAHVSRCKNGQSYKYKTEKAICKFVAIQPFRQSSLGSVPLRSAPSRIATNDQTIPKPILFGLIEDSIR